jgi:cytochrome c oxidase assembly protein subunit 23
MPQQPQQQQQHQDATATIDPLKGKEIKDSINSRINPGGGELKHNYGRPKEAPYAKEKTAEEKERQKALGGPAATFQTSCAKEHRESLQCIERNYQNRNACTEFFDAYKTCRRDENERRKEANARASGNTSGGDSGSSRGGWFW